MSAELLHHIYVAACALGDVLWDVAYVLIIRLGFKHKSYGIPIVALGMNYVWETLFTFVYPPLDGSGAVDLFKASLYGIWFVLDTVIVFQALRYGRARQTSVLIRRHFYTAVGLSFALSALGIYLLFVSLGYKHQDEIAFGMNLLMSILFIQMLVQRPDRNGVSVGAAWCKMFGTALIGAAEVMFMIQGVRETLPIAVFFYAAIFVFDCLYVYLLAAPALALPDAQPLSSAAHA